jgi:lycopene cyclase domain-containing protein
MGFLYLAGLLVGLSGMGVLDLRFRLFFPRGPLRAAAVLVLGIAFFLAWDLAGIGAGVFFPGGAGIVTGVLLAPGLPLEEVFFLALLCYAAMNAYGALTRPATVMQS